jgi:signal peptidase I
MEPTPHCARPALGCEGDTQDRVFVLRFHPFWTPRRGDIVVFDTPPAARVRCGAGGAFVKRLIGLPGETVSQQDGSISVNGTPLSERYIEHGDLKAGAATWHVPPGAYFFLGDNRAQSCDSRAFGSVPRSNLIGPVAAVYWPLDRIGSP